jgi:hypothetical protein
VPVAVAVHEREQVAAESTLVLVRDGQDRTRGDRGVDGASARAQRGYPGTCGEAIDGADDPVRGVTSAERRGRHRG